MNAVFRSLASPARRRILTLLLDEGPMEAGKIAGNFPEMPRPGISRDLRVLKRAGLVEMKKEGRCRIYRLEPTLLKKIKEEWFQRFDRFWESKLASLKRYAEEES